MAITYHTTRHSCVPGEDDAANHSANGAREEATRILCFDDMGGLQMPLGEDGVAHAGQ